MSSKENCSQCMYPFTMSKLPRKLPRCQHSICQSSIRDIIETRQDIIICGFCIAKVKKEDIRIFSLNTSILLSLVKRLKFSSSHLIKKKISCLAVWHQLIARINSSSNIFSLHWAPLDIICILNKQRIFPHCALYGSHRQHRFKRLEDFERQLGEKKIIFLQIQNDKQKAFQEDCFYIIEQLRSKIQLKRVELCKMIDSSFKRYELQLRKRKQTAYHEVEVILSDCQQEFRKNGPLAKFQKTKTKLQQWEKSCIQNLYKLDSTKRVQDRLGYYYQGPLQIVTQGYIFIKQLNNHNLELLIKLKEQIEEIKVKFDQKSDKWFENCVRVVNNASILTKPGGVEEDDTNPFLDCKSSAIALKKSNFLNQNSSIQAQINSIPTSAKRINFDSQTLTRKQSKIKGARSIQQEKPTLQVSTMKSINNQLAQTPKASQNTKRPTSEMNLCKSSAKLNKEKQKNQNEQKTKQI